MALRTAFRPEAAAELPPTDYELRVADVSLRAKVDGDRLTVIPLAPAPPPVGGRLPDTEPDLVFAAGPGIRNVIAGSLTPGDAIDSGVVHVLAGDEALLERFAATFHIDTPVVPASRSELTA